YSRRPKRSRTTPTRTPPRDVMAPTIHGVRSYIPTFGVHPTSVIGMGVIGMECRNVRPDPVVDSRSGGELMYEVYALKYSERDTTKCQFFYREASHDKLTLHYFVCL